MIKIAIIQARLGSKRFPDKVLKTINNIPLLKYQIDRVEKSKLIDKLIIATSKSFQDDRIEEFCKLYNVECFRGEEEDVLDRYFSCAKKYNADIVIRLCADNPLIDPQVIDQVIQFYLDGTYDYVSNGVPPESTTFPDGGDLEVFSINALERTQKEALNSIDREHVTFYMWRYNNNFKTAQFTTEENLSDYRYTVDYPEDFEVVEFIIKELDKRNSFGYQKEIIEIINSNDSIKNKNNMYYFGIGWEQN